MGLPSIASAVDAESHSTLFFFNRSSHQRVAR
jgi:hypothetical protein